MYGGLWSLLVCGGVQAATEARKRVLKLDNLYTNKAVDALLNYETVKLFNNEALEVSQYDEYLVGYQVRFCCEAAATCPTTPFIA